MRKESRPLIVSLISCKRFSLNSSWTRSLSTLKVCCVVSNGMSMTPSPSMMCKNSAGYCLRRYKNRRRVITGLKSYILAAWNLSSLVRNIPDPLLNCLWICLCRFLIHSLASILSQWRSAWKITWNLSYLMIRSIVMSAGKKFRLLKEWNSQAFLKFLLYSSIDFNSTTTLFKDKKSTVSSTFPRYWKWIDSFAHTLKYKSRESHRI